MAKVIVTAPGRVSRRIAGVAFSEGRAEVDTESAAYQFFQRRGYKIGDEQSPVDDESPEGEGEPDGDESTSDKFEDDGQPPVDDKPERPQPVGGSVAAWFEYLTALNPNHGMKLEDGVKRKELIEAANKLDGTDAE